MRGLLILVLYYVCSGIAFSQEMIYRHYTTDNGLQQNQVTCLFQDSRGFLWAGTKAGISRFDGKTFKNYRYNKEMPAVSFIKIFEDDKGDIGFISQRLVYQLVNDTFRYIRPLWKTKFSSIYADNIYFEKGKSFYASVLDTENLYAIWVDRKTGDTVHFVYKHNQMLNDDGYISVVHDKVYVYLSKSNKDTIIIINKIDKKIESTSKRSLKIGRILSEKPFAIDYDNYVCRLNGKKVQRLFQLPDVEIRPNQIEINEFENGGFLVNLYNSQAIFLYTHDFQFKGKVIVEAASCSFRDSQRNIWIGGENGLYCINNPGIQRIEQSIPYLSGVWNLVPEGNIMWIVNYTPPLLRVYQDGQCYEDRSYKVFGEDGIIRPSTLYMGGTTDWKKRPVFTSPDIGILRKEKNGWTKFDYGDNYDAMFVFNDSVNRRTLAGTAKGLMIVDEKDNVRFIDPEVVHPGKRRIVSIAKDFSGNYMLGAFSFLRFWDGKDKIWSLPDSVSPKNMGANTMCADKRGVWIGNNQGLYYFSEGKLQKIHHPHLDDFVTALHKSGDSLLFIGSIKGLSVINLKTFHTKNGLEIYFYDRWNGFTGREVQQNGIVSDSKGRIWIATNDNVFIVDTRFLRFNKTPPKVFLQSLSWLGNDMQWVVTHEGDNLNLKYHQRNIRLDYQGINFSSPERITYSYFLDGYDKGWSILTSETHAVYTNLPPGKYQFKVISCNENGFNSEQALLTEFEILPAIWQRWWFYGLIVLLIAGVSVALTTFINKRRKKIKDRELQINLKMIDLQLRSIRSQMDPHFTFNAINSIGAAIMKNDKNMALKYLQSLSKLIRSTLEHSNKMTRSLDQEIEFVKHYLELEKFRFGDRFDYTIHIPPDISTDLKVPKMILQTYVENSLKHGILPLIDKRGKLSVNISMDHLLLNLSVEDNGVGREAAAEYSIGNTKRGLKIMDQYFEMFKERLGIEITSQFFDLYDAKGQAIGTRVLIKMPFIE
ncbi:MAG: histidine kinase [Bacteroidales bacterium]|nr:histidine kinase [Bacteroidales bacterium]